MACVLLVGSLLAVRADADALKKPRVDMSTRTIGLGFGYGWGRGTLHVGEESHNFTVKSVKVGSVAFSVVEASGDVKNWKTLEKFNGTYVVAEAGVVIGGGAVVLTMVNQHGVAINLLSLQTGFNVTLGGGSLTIELD